jgi:dienelactone hydrolase
METAMRDAGKRFVLVIHPSAPHGFHAGYRPEQARQARS